QSKLSARQFCQFTEVPYASFCRWLARFRRQGAAALRDRSHAPRHCPHKLSGQEETIIRQAHSALRCGVHRLYAYLCAAKLTTRSFASVYRVLSRCGALIKRRRRLSPTGSSTPRLGPASAPRWTSSTCPLVATNSRSS